MYVLLKKTDKIKHQRRNGFSEKKMYVYECQVFEEGGKKIFPNDLIQKWIPTQTRAC